MNGGARPGGARLEVEDLTVVPPGRRVAALTKLSFTVSPGQALGVIGPSGAGKSTLARALAGVWPVAGGRVTLGGARLDRRDPAEPGPLVGYLPQTATLFEGTVAQNVAGLARRLDPDAVAAAARKAGAHETIMGLPDGYGTHLGPGRLGLSGGETQRLGLARALYGDPMLLVLDEPNSNLDNAGSEAVMEAVRGAKAERRLVVFLAHRPTAIAECDLLLVLDGGVCKAFGPRDELLREMVTNHR